MGWKGDDTFAHMVAAQPLKTENKQECGEKHKWDGKKDVSNMSVPYSNHPKHQRQHKKPQHNSGQATKVPDKNAKTVPSGSGQVKNPAPNHNCFFKCDKEGHMMPDCLDKAKAQLAKNA